jgi:NDP-sugar pyrophosphorylase family protein
MKNSVIALLAAALPALAIGSQHQSQSPAGSGSQHQQQSPSDSGAGESSESDKDYATWPNGGGKVHAQAKVDSSALVDKESKVGPHVVVAKDAKIRQSLLMGGRESAPAKVGKSVVIESSTLQGAFVLGDKVQVKTSMLQGPIEVKAGKKLTSCTLTATPGKPAVINTDLTDKMAFLPEAKL